WNGQWVRVQGWVARCQPLDCALAEGPNGNGLRLSFEAAESFDKWVQPMLPAHVEVTARIDSSCLLGLCTDRAPVLRRVYVEPLAPHFTSPSKDK
ncbi:MAG: hypothetical protein ACJ8EY_11110, partial [Sphingomicrobium sp.]